MRSRYKSFGTAIRLRAGQPGFDFRAGPDIFLFSIALRPALSPTQSPIQWVLGALSQGVKQQERETDQSPSSSFEVKNRGATFPLSIFLRGIVLNNVKYKDKFTLLLHIT
jgi:hypothetical protein